MTECRIGFSKTGRCTEMINFEISNWGGIKPVGYKTLRGFIKMLKRQNKVCRDRDVRCKFEITLPIKE